MKKNLRLSSYTRDQVEFLERFAPGRPVDEISAEYNRTFGGSTGVGAIEAFLKRSKIPFAPRKRQPNIHLTTEQLQYLRDFAPEHTASQLAVLFNETFGISLAATGIYALLKRAGIPFKRVQNEKRTKHTYTPEELQFLRDLAPEHTAAELAAMYKENFGRCLSATGMSELLQREGISFQRVQKEKRTVHRYTPEQLDFLVEFAPGRDTMEIMTSFNEKFGTSLPRRVLTHFLTSRGIGCIKENFHRFTAEQKQFIRDHFSTTYRDEITEMFNNTFGTSVSAKSIRAMASLLGVRSEFRRNWNPVGTEIVMGGYLMVRVHRSETSKSIPYKYKQVHVWEQAYGPVPPDMKITFKDGDPFNCALENLVLVSRSEMLHLIQNKYHQTPDELKPSVLALSKLQAKIVQRRKTLEKSVKRS